MARQEIDKAGVRNKLAPRREPYWGAPVERGLFVGYRRLEQGGNWVARFHDEANKKHVYRALGTVSAANDYESAKREAKQWRKSVEAGVQTDRILTVEDVCRDYTHALKREGRDRAALDADKTLTRIVYKDAIGKLRADKLTQRHLEAWLERMEAGKLSGRKKCQPSAATINRHLATFKAAMNRAASRREIPADRAIEWGAIKPYKEADGSRELYLDRDQRRALLESAPADLRDLLTCIALTGCRPGDPAAMLRKDYDHRNGLVTFRTKGHLRTIPVSPAAKALMDRLAKGKLPMARMFTNGGEEWTAQQWAYQVNKAVVDAELPPETVAYSLRHSWITDAIQGGMDLLTVSKLVGTSLKMIDDHYGKLVQDAARNKLAALEFV